MPAFLENALRHEASKRGLTGEAADRYVYGAMQNQGLMSGSKTTAKGEALQAKHEANQRRTTRDDGPPNYTKRLAKKHKD